MVGRWKWELGPLAKARMSSQMRQEDMAEILNCTLPTVVRLERHPEKISVERLREWYHAVPDDGKAIIEKFVDEAVFCVQ